MAPTRRPAALFILDQTVPEVTCGDAARPGLRTSRYDRLQCVVEVVEQLFLSPKGAQYRSALLAHV